MSTVGPQTKARLVARGSDQRAHIDLGELLTPIVAVSNVSFKGDGVRVGS